MRSLIRDLNRLYRSTPADEIDFDPSGFEWVSANDLDNSVLAFLRRAHRSRAMLCVCNFTPVVRHDYRIGAPGAGTCLERLNTDSRTTTEAAMLAIPSVALKPSRFMRTAATGPSP